MCNEFYTREGVTCLENKEVTQRAKFILFDLYSQLKVQRGNEQCSGSGEYRVKLREVLDYMRENRYHEDMSFLYSELEAKFIEMLEVHKSIIKEIDNRIIE